LPVPLAARSELARRIDGARRAVAAADDRGPTGSARWVQPDAFHLTLRFLGGTAPDRVGDVGAAIDEAATGCRPFRVSLGGLAVIGGRRSRILVCELREGIDEVAGLEARLADALAQRRWPPEARLFRPHLTLARSEGSAAPLGPIARTMNGEGIAWTVGEVVLFESRLGSGPPTYIRNAAATLAE
jgi:RNA 2',3'-cyclic 3'-phosphodiesterase